VIAERKTKHHLLKFKARPLSHALQMNKLHCPTLETLKRFCVGESEKCWLS
jgi:hypothetical protein